MAAPVQKWRPEVEQLEDRFAPAALTLRPPGFINELSDLIVVQVSDKAMHGLTTAQTHTGEVVTWSLAGPR